MVSGNLLLADNSIDLFYASVILQLEYIYGNASIPVGNVVVIAFKYGAARESPISERGRSILARSGNNDEQHSIIAKHWVHQ